MSMQQDESELKDVVRAFNLCVTYHGRDTKIARTLALAPII